MVSTFAGWEDVSLEPFRVGFVAPDAERDEQPTTAIRFNNADQTARRGPLAFGSLCVNLFGYIFEQHTRIFFWRKGASALNRCTHRVLSSRLRQRGLSVQRESREQILAIQNFFAQVDSDVIILIRGLETDSRIIALDRLQAACQQDFRL